MKIPFTKYLPWIKAHWVDLLIAIILIAACALLLWWLWRRFGDDLKARWTEFRRAPEIHPYALTRIWSQFHRLIPWAMKRHVKHYPVYLVIGDNNSGKTELISNCAFLGVQDYRYHPSVDDSEYMKVHLGNESIIIELASNFLFTNSKDHGNALLRLWKKLPYNTQLVMTIDAHQLMKGNEENQTRLAESLMGKLALFTEYNQKPVPFSIALSHMDRFQGFNSFLQFCISKQIDFHVKLTRGNPLPDFTGGLEDYSKYASTALVECDAQSFIEILIFQQNVRNTLGALHNLILNACIQNNINETELKKVCLITANLRDEHFGLIENNPFTHEQLPDSYFDNISKKHLKIAGRSLIALTLWCTFNFFDERSTIKRAASLIQDMPAITVRSYPEIVHPVFEKLYRTQGKENTLASGLGYRHFSFYPTQANTVRRNIAGSLRTTYLIPRLELAQKQDHIYGRTIDLLALLHANNQNPLSEYFRKEHSYRMDTLGGQPLPIEIISDYIEFNNDLSSLDIIELGNKPYGVLDPSSQSGLKRSVFPWVTQEIINVLADILDDSYIQEQKLENLRSSAKTIQGLVSNTLEHPYLDEERIWLTLHGNVSPATRAEWEKHPTQAQINSSGVAQALDLISSTTIEPAYIPRNFNHVLKLIQQIISEDSATIKNNKLGIIEIQLANQAYNFDSNKWLTLALHSKISRLLNEYYEQNNSAPGWIFFDPQERPRTLAFGISTDESGVLINNARVDTRLTREAFYNNVKPAIENMTALIDDIPLEPEERQQFLNFFIHQLAAYSGNYANAYWSFFKNIAIHINDPEHLISYLQELQRPGSAFIQNLVRVKENVILDLPIGPNYQPIRDRLEDFSFLKKLMTEQSGSYPELNRYVNIIAGLYASLTTEAELLPPPSDKATQSAIGLRSVLSPLGRVSFDILTGADGSPLRLVEGWLRELSIPEAWRTPFVTPILKTRDFGRNDVNKIIDRQWNTLWNRDVLPLFSSFPFDHTRGGTAPELQPEAINAVFHPTNGRFWVEVRRVFGVLYEIQDGRWAVRPDIEKAFQIPAGMTERLNASSNLTLALWDKDSQPKPLTFKLRVDMIPQTKPMTDANDATIKPALVYLRSGASSALGFNQKSLWQELPMDWWAKGTANAGIEFDSQDEKAKKYASVDIEDSRWALLKLLSQADQSGLTFNWTVSLLEKPEDKLKSTVVFKRDPFELFNALKNR